MNHHRTCGACAARPERRPVSATFRLKILAALNRVRRRLRPRHAAAQPNLQEAHLS